MQAQPQSTSAARIPVTPLSSPPATDHPILFGGHCRAQPLVDPLAQQPLQPSIRHLLAAPAFRPADTSEVEAEIPSTCGRLTASVGGIAHGAGLAHDAGNLLGALGLYCDLLRMPGVLGPEHRHYATELGLIASRSSELIQRLLAAPRDQPQTPTQLPSQTVSARRPLDHARNSSSALEFQPAHVRRRGAAEREASHLAIGHPELTHASALHLLAPVLERIAAGSATVSICAPATLPLLDLSIETMERITVNLVRNAAEAIRMARGSAPPNGLSTRSVGANKRASGTIRVILGVAAGRLRLTVEDDGPGMPPAIAAAFLQPGPLPAKPSRGLGHRIVHELVTASGGHISIRVRPGQGTAFCIRWPVPLSDEDTDDHAKEDLPIKNSGYPGVSLGPGGLPETATTSVISAPGETSSC
jgi:signal transduction histidine kinase